MKAKRTKMVCSYRPDVHFQCEQLEKVLILIYRNHKKAEGKYNTAVHTFVIKANGCDEKVRRDAKTAF